MKINPRPTLTVVLVAALLMLTAAFQVTAQSAVAENEALVMNWIESVFSPAAFDFATPPFSADFVFYHTSEGPALGYDDFIRLDFNAMDLTSLVQESVVLEECVVKGEHDLVEASYVVKGIDFDGRLVPLYRTILFRIEDGRIAEGWLDHSL